MSRDISTKIEGLTDHLIILVLLVLGECGLIDVSEKHLPVLFMLMVLLGAHMYVDILEESQCNANVSLKVTLLLEEVHATPVDLGPMIKLVPSYYLELCNNDKF